MKTNAVRLAAGLGMVAFGAPFPASSQYFPPALIIVPPPAQEYAAPKPAPQSPPPAKPKPPPEEITAAFKSHLRSVPTAVADEPQSAPAIYWEKEGKRRKAPPVVQMNFNITEELADIINNL